MKKEDLIELLLKDLYVELTENDDEEYCEYLYFCRNCDVLFAHPADNDLPQDVRIHGESCDNYCDLINLGKLSYNTYKEDIADAVDCFYDIVGEDNLIVSQPGNGEIKVESY